MSMMSLSPTTSTSNYDDQPNGKRRRTTSFTSPNGHGSRTEMASPQDSASGAHGMGPAVPSAHIPKRGALACTNCRKGKNRCEGEVRALRCSHDPLPPVLTYPLPLVPRPVCPPVRPARPPQAPCRRCQLSGAQCVFEKPEKKNVQALSSASVE